MVRENKKNEMKNGWKSDFPAVSISDRLPRLPICGQTQDSVPPKSSGCRPATG